MKTHPLLIATLLLLDACDPAPGAPGAPGVSGAPGAADAAAPRPSASAAPAPTSAPAPASSAAPAKGSLSLLKLTLTSAVKDREPVDELKSAGPGERVWVHLVVRNRTGEARRVSLIFRVDGEERSTVDLKVEPSWSYRTWGYNTLRAADKTGELTVEVRELGGEQLAVAKLPIKPGPRPEPAAK